jgi:hypothetical protein
MTRDPIVEEVRRIRDEFAKEHDYDIKKIVQALRTREDHSKRTYVTRSPRKPSTAKTA